MASTYFFNGELYTSPAVMSAVDDTAMAPTNPTVGNVVAMIGSSAGGQPGVPLVFQDPTTAQATLVSGELCQAVVKAFSASNDTNSPSKVIAIRVDEATQSSLTLKDASGTDVCSLTSVQYGLPALNLSVAIAAGSVSGVLATISNGKQSYSQDNIGRDAFEVSYAGTAASATIGITDSTVVLSSPAGTPVATFALASYPTVQALVGAINATPGFSATILDGQAGYTPALNGLDSAATQDVKTQPYTATANLQAFIDWVNAMAAKGGYVTAARVAGGGAQPALLSATLLIGTAPTPAMIADWTNALSALQTVDVQWIAVLTANPAVWAALDAHCQYMSTAGQKERRGFAGPALGLTAAAAEAIGITVNSDRTAFAWPGHADYDVASGALVTWAPYMTAALIAAGFAGLNPGETMTNKTLTIEGLETQVRNPTDTDALIQSGVIPVEEDNTGFTVTRAVSSWLQNNKYNRVEISCGAAVDYMMRNVRSALKVLKGQGVSPRSVGRAVQIATSMLTSLAKAAPTGPGVIVGDDSSPPFQNVTAQGSGDAIIVDFQASPVIPANFIPVTAAIVPFSGTVTSTVSS